MPVCMAVAGTSPRSRLIDTIVCKVVRKEEDPDHGATKSAFTLSQYIHIYIYCVSAPFYFDRHFDGSNFLRDFLRQQYLERQKGAHDMIGCSSVARGLPMVSRSELVMTSPIYHLLRHDTS